MTLKEIIEIENDKLKLGKPIKENMSVLIPDIDPNLNIPCGNNCYTTPDLRYQSVYNVIGSVYFNGI